MLGLGEFLDALLALASSLLGGAIEVLSDFVLVNLDEGVDSIFHAPLDEEQLADCRVEDFVLYTKKEQCAAAIGVEKSAVQALEGRIIRDAWINEAQIALAVANLGGDALALGKVGDGPIVHAETRHGAAFVIERHKLLTQEVIGDKANPQKLLQFETLALLEANVNKLVTNHHRGGLVKPKRAEALGADCSQRVFHILVELVRLPLARRTVTRALQSGDTRFLHFRCREI